MGTYGKRFFPHSLTGHFRPAMISRIITPLPFFEGGSFSAGGVKVINTDRCLPEMGPGPPNLHKILTGFSRIIQSGLISSRQFNQENYRDRNQGNFKKESQ
jgi:hypothetical protein